MRPSDRRSSMRTLFCFGIAVAISSIASGDTTGQPADAKAETKPLSFHREIQPIFSRNCFGCHQAAKRLGSYSMTDFASLLGGGETERQAIVPGKPGESFLIDQITPIDGHAEMPDAPFERLSDIEIELITRWIAEGATNDSPADVPPDFGPDHPPVYSASAAMPSLDISPDGKRIAVAGFHEVVVIDADSGKTLSRLIGMSSRINTVRFSPDGKRIAVAGGTPAVRGELQVWDADSNALLLSRLITFDTLCGASWSPDGTMIAFGASDNVVRAVNSETGEQVLFQGAHDDWVRDTAFTPDGKHLISVGRDMSCKLTEIETQRFVDNVTSITPGALSGGLSSVAAHPTRNEILIGGADGIAKVYRVFRETARKIGDDANLIRALPKMPGRIFSVAINNDATRLAAASTLDGHSEVCVWQYDFSGDLDEELKGLLAKRDSERNAEENNRVEAYQKKETHELARVAIDEAAVYAIRFASDGSLVTTAKDGKVRRIDVDGNLAATFDVFEISPSVASPPIGFDAKAWNEMVTSRMEKSFDEAKPSVEAIESILISPARINFASPYDYTQLIVTAVVGDGLTIDITRTCQIDVPDWITLTADGLLRPIRDGAGTVSVQLGKQKQTIDVSAIGVTGEGADHGSVDYIRDVAPVLSRLGCNSGTCHGAQKGKNGFRLSLRGYDPVFDLRALTDDLSARRINAAAPEESLMLVKPLGITPHQGGTLMTSGDPNHTILRRWIADGSQLNLQSSGPSHIEVFPINPIVQSTNAKQQVRVVAHYADGSSRDVTREAFIESGNTEVATSDKSGLLSAVRRGEAPILARFEGAYAATTLTVMGDRGGYESAEVQTWSRIDELVSEKWDRVKVMPSELCDDATFLRRVYLDLTGLPPTSDHVRAFLADDSPMRTKRSRVIDDLIGSESYVEYWTNKWADLLQVNRKFLGVEGSTKFRDWIREKVASNQPYNEFATQVLTATGSNNVNPPASYFKVLRTPEDTMENTTQLFLGIRFNCNKCHDHPFERWTQDQYYEMSAFFAQVGLEKDPESGDRNIGGTAVEGAKPLFENVVDKNDGEVTHPQTGKPVVPTFPFEATCDVSADATRRARLADWITATDNPYFARSYVNRLWGYLLGVGLIEPIDDIRAGNPPSNAELLDHLTDTFVDSGFNVAQMLRTICNSRTYQLSVDVNSMNEDDKLNYSHALPRRLPAEVIYDAVHLMTGAVSQIPGVANGTRAAALSDSGVELADGFLQNLGRPVRESACECERSSDLQLGPVMALISGPTIGSAIADPKNELHQIVEQKTDDRELVDELFLRAIGRSASDDEFAAFAESTSMIGKNHSQILEKLAKSEQDWKIRRAELESIREGKLAETTAKIEARKVEIGPERERLEKERVSRIESAQAVVATENEKLDEKVETWSKQLDASEQWFPLAASKLSATNKAQLIPQSDRSIVAEGEKDKGIYVVTVRTKLKNITGFRLEAIADPSLPAGGPGLGANGNFVLTEFEVSASKTGKKAKPEKVKIASGKADFLQEGFKIEETFDGNERDQTGWAVSGALGQIHWATFQLAEPISNDGGSTLTFKMHQFHNAADHRLGRFRISATIDDAEIGLSRPEVFDAILATPKAQRSEESTKLLRDYVASTDVDSKNANAGLAEASKPVPPDEALVDMEKRKAELSVATADAPALVQLREDAAQSTSQLSNVRLTAAEDLTWALINSPAFLFNH